jgi:hypothetical protein
MRFLIFTFLLLSSATIAGCENDNGPLEVGIGYELRDDQNQVQSAHCVPPGNSPGTSSIDVPLTAPTDGVTPPPSLHSEIAQDGGREPITIKVVVDGQTLVSKTYEAPFLERGGSEVQTVTVRGRPFSLAVFGLPVKTSACKPIVVTNGG